MAMNPKLAEFLRKQAEKKLLDITQTQAMPGTEGKKESFAMSIILDEDQEAAVELARSGKSFCLIGKAGTGKTTSEREIMRTLLEKHEGQTHCFRIQGTTTTVEAPAITVVAFTRVAAGNSKKAICKDPELEKLSPCITTIHNLLEFAPEFYWNAEKEKESMRFSPKRDAGNPLTVKTICMEESSMIDLPLWNFLFEAMQRGTQCIFIGDINQLPPVFGPSILNYALTQLPIIELKTVYRQALESSVLRNAHHILEGKPLEEAPDFRILEGGPIQKGEYSVMLSLKASIQLWLSKGTYDPETDIVLSPFNVGDLGTDSINYHLAELFNPQAIVHEIIAGVRKLYLAVGDKIMYKKQVGMVTAILGNGLYSGKMPKSPSRSLSRFGVYHSTDSLLSEEDEDDGLISSFNTSLEQLSSEELDELKHQASSTVEIQLETGESFRLSKAGELSGQNFSLAYALTVHKAQGCEWRRVIIVMHKAHSRMAFNELLYTAVTRASKEVTIVAKKYLLDKAIATRRIKGSTLRDKIEYFNANMRLEGITCTKV